MKTLKNIGKKTIKATNKQKYKKDTKKCINK